MLKGKNAVVVGGAGLIGREVVSALAQAGARVVIADNNVKIAKKLAKLLSDAKGKVTFADFDISKLEDLKSNIDTLVKSLKGIDVWVNCAYPKLPIGDSLPRMFL